MLCYLPEIVLIFTAPIKSHPREETQWKITLHKFDMTHFPAGVVAESIIRSPPMRILVRSI